MTLLIFTFSDENGGRRQPKTNPNFYTNSSIKSSGSDRSTKKKISHDDQPDVPRKTFDTGDPKNVERLYDTRVRLYFKACLCNFVFLYSTLLWENIPCFHRNFADKNVLNIFIYFWIYISDSCLTTDKFWL